MERMREWGKGEGDREGAGEREMGGREGEDINSNEHKTVLLHLTNPGRLT